MRIRLAFLFALMATVAIPAAAEPGDHVDRERAERPTREPPERPTREPRERPTREPRDVRDFNIDRTPRERSTYERAIADAPREARERAERAATERAQREARESRREAGLDRPGVNVGGGNRVGGDVKPGEGRVDINISRDWNPK